MRVFGTTGVKLTVIGQAGARLALLRTKEAARPIVRHAYDLGLNYFDCAHAYWDGHSEEVYRACRPSYIDLWQMHAIQDQKDIDRIFAPGGAIEAFEAARKAGKCRFIGFTGHHDPNAHVAMLKAYDKWDSILMPLHAADPAYLSFEKITLLEAKERGIGIQAIKVFANAFLLRVLNAEECLKYALSLPISCAAVGCSTTGQLDDDVRTAQNFKPYSADEMAELRHRAVTAGPGGLQGPAVEYWKIGGVWK